MFLCEKCHKEGGCEGGHRGFKSYGVCEHCKQVADCYDCHSYNFRGKRESKVIGLLVEWIESLIDALCDQECPHCNRPLNLPNAEDIENWLKGEK